MDQDQDSTSCSTFLEYHGTAVATQDCADAVERLLQAGRTLHEALILTFYRPGNSKHALLITDSYGGEIMVKSGFSSGYGGNGPKGFSATLALLHWHGVALEEALVDDGIIERLDESALTRADLDTIRSANRIRPQRLWEYIFDEDDHGPSTINPWRLREPNMPFAIFDHRLAATARDFWDDPDGKLMKAHRRLEEAVREKAGISIEEASNGPARMYAAAFNGKPPRLTWPGIIGSEHVGRANLFLGVLQAYRHPRAHRSLKDSRDGQISELLLLNQLYRLEAEAVAVSDASAA